MELSFVKDGPENASPNYLVDINCILVKSYVHVGVEASVHYFVCCDSHWDLGRLKDA